MIGFLKHHSALGISKTLSSPHFTPVAWHWRSRITPSTCSSLRSARCLPDWCVRLTIRVTWGSVWDKRRWVGRM